MLLSARNITKSYGFTTILRDASLSLDVRERVGIVGANGADLWELRDGRITLHPARSDGALSWMGSDAPRRAGA